MKIGISGPIETEVLIDYIDFDDTFYPKGLGGSPITSLIKALLEKGNDVSVYTLSPDIVKPFFLAGKKLRIFIGPYRERHKMRDLMRKEIIFIRNFIKNDEPEIVHAHWSYEFALGALYSSRPTLVTFHDWAPHILYFSKDLYRLGRLIMNYITIIKANHFSVVSPYLKNYLQKYVKKELPVIPNGLDKEIFREKDIEKDDKIIAVNNGFSKLKNVKIILKAFKLIREKLPTYSLYLIGKDFGKGEMAEKWAKENHLEQGVFFIGSLPYKNLLTELSNSKLFIHSSFEESFGMVLIEAMAKKIPVIGGKKSGAVPWILENGKSGILIDVKSYQDIAQQALTLLTDNSLWLKYSDLGYKYAKNNFLISDIAEQYIVEYKNIKEISA